MRTWFRDVASQIASWVCIAIIGALGVWLASLTPVIASYAPLSYLVTALLVIIVAAIAFGLLGRAKREWWPVVPPPPVISAGDTGLPQELVDDIDVISATVRRNETKAIELEARLEERLAEVQVACREYAAATKDYADGVKDALIAGLAREAGERAGLGQKIEKLGELNNENLDYARRQIASIYEALSAIYQRERLEQLSAAIEAGAAELRGPTDRQEDLNDTWDDWETKHRAWRSVLEEWCALANCYSRGIKEKVLMVAEDELHQEGKAGLSQFPTIAALMIYRGFNIRYFKWRNWRDAAREAVRKVAIEGTAQTRPIYNGTAFAGERDDNSRGAALRRIIEGDDAGQRP